MLLIVLTTMLCWACSSDDATGSPDGTRPMLTIAVSEQAWSGETVSITRAGETLDALKASTAGFGVYSTDLGLSNQQVIWNGLLWYYGSALLWPNNHVPESSDLLAYAPYTDLTPVPDSGITACTGTSLTFSPEAGNMTDLLWANSTVSKDDGTLNLTFHHALAKLTLGTITNSYGRTITMKEVKFEGNRYASGTLSLTTGEWSSLPDPSSSSKSFGSDTTPTLSQILEGSPAIPNGESVSFKAGSCYLQIPGPAIKVSYTFSTDDYGDQTVSTDVVLEQGKDKTVNLTIGMNHEVVIK
jgi:hypothetical protein